MENGNTEVVIADAFEKTENPKIYSKKAIWGFSVFFSAIFGGILLMQNLRDVGKKKEANQIFIYSIIYTIITIVIINAFDKQNTSMNLLFNIAGGGILSEYYFKNYFPNDEELEKKKIWKPLIISILITIPLIAAAIYARENNL